MCNRLKQAITKDARTRTAHEGYCFTTQQAAREMINLDCSITHPERKLRYTREKQIRLIANVEGADQPKVHTPERQDMLLQEGSHTVRELEWWRHQVPQIFCTAKPVTHRQAHCHIGKTKYQHKVSRERHMRRCDCSKGEFTKQNQLHRCQESAQFLLMSNSIKSCCKFAGFKFKFQVA